MKGNNCPKPTLEGIKDGEETPSNTTQFGEEGEGGDSTLELLCRIGYGVCEEKFRRSVGVVGFPLLVPRQIRASFQ